HDWAALDRDDAPQDVSGHGRGARRLQAIAVAHAREDDRTSIDRGVGPGSDVKDLCFAKRWRRVQHTHEDRRPGGSQDVLGGGAELVPHVEENEAAHPPRIRSSLSSSSRTKVCTSAAARWGVTSNSRTITSTMSSTLRWPSISSHTRLPTGFSPRNAFV